MEKEVTIYNVNVGEKILSQIRISSQILTVAGIKPLQTKNTVIIR